MSCPRCQEDAKFVGYRPTGFLTLFGEVTYERAYYHCRDCRPGGFFPTDLELGLVQKRSRAATELIALAGVLEPFEECSHRLLHRMAGLRVCKSVVQQTTERVGEDVAERRSRGEAFGPEPGWNWQQDAQGQAVAYVGLDATSVAQQNAEHGQAEGRMPWVACVFNPQPMHQQKRKPLREVRYLSGLMPLEEIGQQLRRECQAVKVQRADVVIGLSDGGSGLENCLREAVRGMGQEIRFILDFYHVSEHLLEFGKLYCREEAERDIQVQRWCEQLKHQGGEVLHRELKQLAVGGRSESVQESHRQLLGYLGNNLHRLDYPEYVSRGWQIGSGVIESACKSVVGGRLKGSGMRWREYGTNAVCQLRALYKSKDNLWKHYWKQFAVP